VIRGFDKKLKPKGRGTGASMVSGGFTNFGGTIEVDSGQLWLTNGSAYIQGSGALNLSDPGMGGTGTSPSRAAGEAGVRFAARNEQGVLLGWRPLPIHPSSFAYDAPGPP
jgi:hypothetical protein